MVDGEQELAVNDSQALCFSKFEHFANFTKCWSLLRIALPTPGDAKAQLFWTITWQMWSKFVILFNFRMKIHLELTIKWHCTSQNF
jgi:hypothetical protein